MHVTARRVHAPNMDDVDGVDWRRDEIQQQIRERLGAVTSRISSPRLTTARLDTTTLIRIRGAATRRVHVTSSDARCQSGRTS